MKNKITALALLIAAGMVLAAPAEAHGWEHKHHWHGHGYSHHHHHHHHGPHWARGYYYAPPPPPPRVIYREVPVYPQAPAYRPPHRRISEIVPMAAGGIIGGVVGDQAGYGNPAAIIGGSVLGSVLGHEIAQ
jgi:hypothetical protein